jgi:hypothetical protein
MNKRFAFSATKRQCAPNNACGCASKNVGVSPV